MEAKKIWFDNEFIFVETNDNRIGKMPLEWFPRLKNSTIEELEAYELWADNSWIHWESIGEDLSVEGFFSFNKDLQQILIGFHLNHHFCAWQL
jgi:hypothetical protein